MNSLAGLRVAILEARMAGELAALIRRAGGEPCSVPAVRELPLDCREAVELFIHGLAAHRFDIVVFLTGAGARALMEEAGRLGRLPEVVGGLKRVITVCRGPKPVAVLKRYAVPVSMTAPEPHTGAELLGALTGLKLGGKGIALLHYGERSSTLTRALQSRGAQLTELSLYEWRMPEDVGPLQRLVGGIVAGRVQAVAFTSQIQVRHLFEIARELKQADSLAAALNLTVIAASIGPTCTAALRQLGVEPAVVPEHPKMGQLVAALANFVKQSGRCPAVGD